jgi:3-oxoadipate enol-lactonase
MPHARVNGTSLYYEQSGDGPETIVFAHGCLLSCRMFDGIVAALKERFRCVTFDFRGQGQSAIPASGYDMDSLAEDTAALIRLLGCAPCHFLGFSMGGFVGMRLAVEHPELLHSLILAGTSASPEPHAFRYRMLCWLAWLFGPRAVTRWVMPVQFGQAFLNDPQRAEERQLWYERMATNDRLGSVRAAGGVIDRPDYSSLVSRVRVPTLIVAGEADRATPPAEAEKLHTLIAGSRLELIPGAGHAVPIEEPAAVSELVNQFLVGLTRSDLILGKLDAD